MTDTPGPVLYRIRYFGGTYQGYIVEWGKDNKRATVEFRSARGKLYRKRVKVVNSKAEQDKLSRGSVLVHPAHCMRMAT